MVQRCSRYLRERGCSVRHTLVLIGALLICFCVDGCAYNVGILISYWSSYFSRDNFIFSWVGCIQMFFYYSLGPITGFLINKFGVTSIAITGAIMSAIGHFVSGMFGNLVVLFVFFGVIAGAGYGLLYLAAIISVTTSYDGLRPIAIGIMACGSGIGASVHSLIYPLIEKEVTWKGLCISTAGLMLQACVFGCLIGLTLPKKPPQPLQKSGQLVLRRSTSIFNEDHKLGILGSGYLGCQNEPGPSNKVPKSLADIKYSLQAPKLQHVLGSLGSFTYLVEVEKIAQDYGLFGKGLPLYKNKSFLIFVVAVFVQSLGSYSPIILFFDMLISEGFETKKAATTTALIGIFSAIARLLFGTLATFRWVNKRYLLISLLIIGGIMNTTIYMFRNDTFLNCYASFIGLLQGGITVLHPLVLANLVQRERLPEAMGWEIMCLGLGLCLSTPLAASVSMKLGDVRISYIVSGILMVVGGLLVFATFCTHREISEAAIKKIRRRLQSRKSTQEDENVQQS
ncbi:unnamed protein product [Hymenolepis diminuta]|uniref:MFS domain-containing protein n=1 Tax=Hymenolepis diminuta TaxID=6216 RepID=A0A0R3ST20_HYMDI|nr:unnamed protein product [Hymenolepis diminuta]